MTGVAELGRLRQVLLAGRIAETVTGRPLVAAAARLEVLEAGAARALPADFRQDPSGWYAFSTSGLPALPTPPLTGPASLRLTVTLADGRVRQGLAALDDAGLARVARVIRFGSAGFAATVLAGAPFALDLTFDPAAIALSGMVIGDHDPAQPVANASVSMGALAATTGSDGRFRLGPLPVASVLSISVDHGATHASFPFRPDYSTPLNHTELSIPL